MNSSFKIGAVESVSAEARLLIEISLYGISWVIIDNGNECVLLHKHHFAPGMTIDKAADELKKLASQEQLLHENFKGTTVIYTHPHAVLVPSDLLQEEHKKPVLELVWGDMNDTFIRTDFLFRQYTHNIYPVPRQVDAVVSYLFSSPVTTHLYSLLPDMYQSAGDHLHCIFASTSFTAMLVNNGKLQAIQTFSFKTPEDVVYYLLQLCEAFETNMESLVLHLNGMIDKASNLYAELYKYFMQVEFATLPGEFTYPYGILDYPSHYFSYLLTAATCV